MSEQHTEPRPPSFGERARGWARKAVLALILIAAAVGGYFLAESFLPRWWAQQIGHRVDGSFSGGIGIGLAIGFVCTFLPIMLIQFAILWRRRWKNIPAIVCGVGAVLTALPNLLTLSVVLGGGNGAHAGERIFDVSAPAFRGASLWGAIGGVLLAAVVGYFVWGYRRRGRQLHQAAEAT
ncbi:hypothetical protein [Mycolicibacterium fallax]|jgi:hypothetical protein|uniref:hypothetical protein n=1 Tax=Mycolicibacterium fallax TaxID=1793 RepID=UPI00138CAF08|nr:hypothetical protein [Mycolicibacterium fallax]BBY96952.1 hypothetical protein MFAL_04190 [Mycolicibacterium fallax]